GARGDRERSHVPEPEHRACHGRARENARSTGTFSPIRWIRTDPHGRRPPLRRQVMNAIPSSTSVGWLRRLEPVEPEVDLFPSGARAGARGSGEARTPSCSRIWEDAFAMSGLSGRENEPGELDELAAERVEVRVRRDERRPGRRGRRGDPDVVVAYGRAVP